MVHGSGGIAGFGNTHLNGYRAAPYVGKHNDKYQRKREAKHHCRRAAYNGTETGYGDSHGCAEIAVLLHLVHWFNCSVVHWFKFASPCPLQRRGFWRFSLLFCHTIKALSFGEGWVRLVPIPPAIPCRSG